MRRRIGRTNLARLWRRVQRGFIRVDADEMTYPGACHPALPAGAALIAGPGGGRPARRLERRAFSALLGIVPPDDARGCLQDIHWYDGAFGYFPSYTLGAMAAAQLMAAARREVPGWMRAGRGDVAPLLGWLRAKVHGQGICSASTTC